MADEVNAEAAAAAAGLGRLDSRSGRVRDLFFHEGKYDFALSVDQLVELQDLTKAGPLTLLNRLVDGAWRIEDVKEPLRLGLIGAGMDREAAHALVGRAVRPGYLAHSALKASRVMQAVVFGIEEDMPGELTGEADLQSQTSPMAGSAGPGSSAPAPL